MSDRSEQHLEFEQTPCPLCGADDARTVLTGRDNLYDVPGEFRLVRCRNCRHVYMNPRPTLETIGLCYPAGYGPHQADTESRAEPALAATQPSPGKTDERTPWYLTSWGRLIPGLRRLYYWLADSKSEIIPPVASDFGRALELGCAHGGFLTRLREAGWTAVGVELSAEPAQCAIERGFEVHVGTLESAGFSAGSFDVVFAWHVMEHLHDPRATLMEIHRVLKPRGWFAFSVPNFGCWERRVFGQSWHALELPRHLQHFTSRSLTRLLAGNDFDVVRVIHQRNLLNITGSVGIVLQRWFPRASIGRRVTAYADHPTMWGQLAMAPLAKFLALIHQGGRLTVIARRREGPPSDKDSLP